MRILISMALAWLAITLAPVAVAAGSPFTLSTAGCPMSHCNTQLSDAVGDISPQHATLVSLDSAFLNGTGGVGCASNTHIVACTAGGDPTQQSNLVVYDANGSRMWDDGGQLGATAWMSAPIVGNDTTVIAADQNWILRADPVNNVVLWKSAKPDAGIPISPVPIGNGLILLATNSSDGQGAAEISVWDASTGALLSHQPLIDAITGVLYVTRNTPAVNGNRAYVSTAAESALASGRLYAIDVCDSDTCGGRGKMAIGWAYDFTGPSGASPLAIGSRIFFDGQTSNGAGVFMAVNDLGSSGALVWKRAFASVFAANAARDPRGGLWVYPAESAAMLRLDQNTGATDQQFNISSVLSLPAGYTPNTCVSMSSSQSGDVVLTFGTYSTSTSPLPTYVAAVDVSSTATATRLWRYKLAPNRTTNQATGQFPILVNANGSHRIAFRGSNSGAYFIGEQ